MYAGMRSSVSSSCKRGIEWLHASSALAQGTQLAVSDMMASEDRCTSTKILRPSDRACRGSPGCSCPDNLEGVSAVRSPVGPI